jgi:hypothetical protein
MRPQVGLIVFFSLVVPATLWSDRARATDCSAIVSPCVNDDSLWPHGGPALFAAIGSVETVAAHNLGFGLVTSYLSRPIVWQLQSPGNASQQFAINDQANGTFLWSYGVASRLELDLALPLTWGQGGAGLAPVTGGAGLSDTAVRDMRFGFAYAILRHKALFPSPPGDAERTDNGSVGLAARFEVSAPTGDRGQFAGERSGVFVPSLATEYRLDRWFAGAEIGARIRPTTELLGAQIGTQIVTALGVGVDILDGGLLSATLEGWALPVLVGQDDIVLRNGAYANKPNGQTLVPGEWQLSARTAPLAGGGLSLQLGGGGGLPLGGESELTPRLRSPGSP